MHIIAEAGVNHNGDPELAAELIRAAAAAGADIVKFQTFKAGKLVTRAATQAQYQQRNLGTTGEKTQFEMLQALELGFDDFRQLKVECQLNGVQFLSTPFDTESALFLTDQLGETMVKIGSGDFDNYPLLITLARRGVDVILSTGMSTLGEIEISLGALAFGYLAPAGATPSTEAFLEAFASAEARRVLAERVTVLHCTTEYPAPPESLNLRVISTIRQAYGVRTGFSDHSEGQEAAIAAFVLGATMVEKHITLDRTMPGPDHKASMEPAGFGEMVAALRRLEVALGDGVKRMMAAEASNKGIARKSPVAARAIRAGEVFTEENITLKRTRGGAQAGHYYRLLGQKAAHDLADDEILL